MYYVVFCSKRFRVEYYFNLLFILTICGLELKKIDHLIKLETNKVKKEHCDLVTHIHSNGVTHD